MRITKVAVALLVALPAVAVAQDADRSVAGGGIAVKGWKGRIDAPAMQQGKTINDSKLSMKDGKLDLKIGPAGIYWNDATKASGNYEVKATFTENKFNAGHPHSYGMFIGGSDLETESQRYLYCIAYANGNYAVKYFNGPQVTNVVRRAPTDAIKKAAEGGTATNEIGWRVQGNKASCVINGVAVQTWDASELVGDGKLKSFDGNYGIRVTHNLDLTVSTPTLAKK